ncbi:MAG: S16 family serine protease, partial [Bacteroides sp.]
CFTDKEIKPDNLYDYLGAEEYTRDKYQGNDYAGVVTGLAWTAVGGEILFIETSLSKGKGGKLTLTGNLGDVMKESAVLALEYIKAHSGLLHLDEEIFNNWNIHLHVPEGAIPKDGPSAGITMATALASALTQRKVKANLAMTGEITLRGKVLPVGGIKEKILAAKRAGIKEIILSKENKKNIEEIPEVYLNGVTFHYVADIKEVFDLALTDEKVSEPIDFNLKKND